MNINGLFNNWICAAKLHDHPDVSWEIDEATAGELILIWESLPPSNEHAEKKPQPGYMGCSLISASDEKWHTYRGLISYYSNDLLKGSRKDRKRVFEKKILSSIPHTAE